MPERVLLDVCCGRWGWSKEFARRGWKCIGVDLEWLCWPPENCEFERNNLFSITAQWIRNLGATFGVASTPCTEFAKFGMRMFHAAPPYPENGIKMFKHAEKCFTEAGIPFVMENVRSAQQFLGDAVNHCGPFYLWGNAVPPIMPQGIIKGMTREAVGYREFKGSDKWNRRHALISFRKQKQKRKELVAMNSEIPRELSACVADYAERLLEQKEAMHV